VRKCRPSLTSNEGREGQVALSYVRPYGAKSIRLFLFGVTSRKRTPIDPRPTVTWALKHACKVPIERTPSPRLKIMTHVKVLTALTGVRAAMFSDMVPCR